jgi:hypothetical protein
LLLFFLVGTFDLLIQSDSKNPRKLVGATVVPRFERPFCSIEELHEQQLGVFESMARSDVGVVIPAALHYCAEHDVVAPAWLVKASADLLCELLCSVTYKERNLASNIVTQHRRNMRDRARYDEVCDAREQQKLFRSEITELRALLKDSGHGPKVQKRIRDRLKEKEKILKRLGHTLNDACKYASMALAKTEARGRWSVMKLSYLRVNKNMKDQKLAMRYYIFESQFLRKLRLKNFV